MRPRHATAMAFVAVLLLCAAGRGPAWAQAKDSCGFFQGAVRSGEVIPDKLLLADWRGALRCLAGILDGLKPAVEDAPQAEAWKQVVRAAGAIRIIIANNDPAKLLGADDKAGLPINPAITAFRTFATLDAVSTLAYAARSDDENARLNALLVLGNVIDNQTVCVPIDHLYFKDIGIKGRANLLSVVSVVAPWAYKQNYENIDAVYHYTSDLLKNSHDDVRQTLAILDNIRKRLDYQSTLTNPNKDASLPEDLRACKSYRSKWAGDRLKYAF
ncbi:MAG TPA: hypothetical protein VKX28_26635 [Xanthobacteraceae bacterium]|nr:hypothetical protein [Xanthobacteraceae bacterium]